MAQQKLTEFFREKEQKLGRVNWTKKKKDWLSSVNKLYKRIEEEYLGGLVQDKVVSIARSKKTIEESLIGQYDIDELVIQVGTERVVFSPKGRNVVGASGRVDLIGDMGRKTLVLQPGDRWGIVKTRTPTLKVVPLDEDTLLEALKDVMRS